MKIFSIGYAQALGKIVLLTQNTNYIPFDFILNKIGEKPGISPPNFALWSDFSSPGTIPFFITALFFL